jgi:hypothetical protein
VTLADGRVLRSPELVGAIFSIVTGAGPMTVRIGGVERDAATPVTPVWLHRLSVRAPNGTWLNYCTPGPDGRSEGFPLSGRATGDGSMRPARNGELELVCTSGARGKCVRLGYRPWEGRRMLALFNACTRMVRADYGGTGESHTRAGMKIAVSDDPATLGPAAFPGLVFEAGWTPHGAVCVHHVRVKAMIALAALPSHYPRLKGRTGDRCTARAAKSMGAILFNRSVQ